LLFFDPAAPEKIPYRVKNKSDLPVWRQPDGKPVSCVEKIKVLNENLAELRQMAQDALEDAILMGCDEAQVRDVLQRLIASIENPYRKPDRNA
jgi:hypothetical protein